MREESKTRGGGEHTLVLYVHDTHDSLELRDQSPIIR